MTVITLTAKDAEITAWGLFQAGLVPPEAVLPRVFVLLFAETG